MRGEGGEVIVCEGKGFKGSQGGDFRRDFGGGVVGEVKGGEGREGEEGRREGAEFVF